mmetsp:Transcript_3992/g.7618  ORF Transcript_3992/g.7618 Transcript_3992/m.7618 type:complete len:674 (-) Transcript_3992:217-2238(-)
MRLVSLICSLPLISASAAFVPASSAITKTTVRRDYASASESSRRVSINLTSLASTKNGRGSNQNKYANNNNYATRIPKGHQDEVVGITGGLGLWGEIRHRTRGRRRQLFQEKLNSVRLKQSGRRRKKLVSRFQKYMQGNKSSSSQGDSEGEMGIDDPLENEEEDEEANLCSTSLDSMRARAGVIRTRIRLRQDSLSNLQRLISDVRLELKRMDWKNIFDADAGYTNRTVFMYGLSSGKEEVEGKDTDTDAVMNEFELASINEKWERHIKNENKGNDHLSKWAHDIGRGAHVYNNGVEEEEEEPGNPMEELQLERMERRSLKLQNSILLDRIRLQRLERRILCLESNELGILESAVSNTLVSLNEFDPPEANPITVVQRQAKKFVNTFGESTSVLLRKLDRVQSKSGRNNRDYASVTDFVARETFAGVRIVGSLLSNPSQLSQLVDPETPSLVPHVPAILARLDRLESHVTPILSRVLNNKQHLRSIEPYLDEILERFDDIEPHLPWILDHIDTLAPYTGLLLKHIDELLLYAEVDEYEAGDDNYAFAEQLLPYLEVYVSQLDLVGPHLPLLRPHLPLLLKHNRIKILSPHVGALFAKGYTDLSASANMDVLLFYFGWALRIPLVPRCFFALAPPATVSFLANRMPKRLVRGRCCDVTCFVDGDYGEGWNELSK